MLKFASEDKISSTLFCKIPVKRHIFVLENTILMNLLNKKNDNALAAMVHLSTFSKYFIPFGNFIFPLILWTVGRGDKFVDGNARQALNFQISLFLYSIFIIGAAASGAIITASTLDAELNIGIDTFYVAHGEMFVPFLVILSIGGILLLALLILDIISTITATMKASEDIVYEYPLSIPFLRSSNQSENEQFNNNMKNETL